MEFIEQILEEKPEFFQSAHYFEKYWSKMRVTKTNYNARKDRPHTKGEMINYISSYNENNSHNPFNLNKPIYYYLHRDNARAFGGVDNYCYYFWQI